MSRPKNDEGYMGNPNVKRDGVEAEFTEEQIKEYRKCMMDPAYFARTYLKVISLDDGLVPFDLYPYQENMFNHFSFHSYSNKVSCCKSSLFALF